jgi:hypothetical protein
MATMSNRLLPGLLSAVLDDTYNGLGAIKQIQYKPKKVLKASIASIGILMPFWPSMYGEQEIKPVMKETLLEVERKMKDRYSEACIKKLLIRLERIFSRLNFNTHGKALGIILTAYDEKIYYLDFQVELKVLFEKKINLLDLAFHRKQLAEFYTLVLDYESIALYECIESKSNKILEVPNPGFNKQVVDIATRTIEQLNVHDGKPVFVMGEEMLLNQFSGIVSCPAKYFLQLPELEPFNCRELGLLSQRISSHWSYWYTRHLHNLTLRAQNEDLLIVHAMPVLKKLSKGSDGVLLIGKHLLRELTVFKEGRNYEPELHDLVGEIEKFIIRGNRIVFVEDKFVKELGGILLLPFKEQQSGIETSYHFESDRTGMLL